MKYLKLFEEFSLPSDIVIEDFTFDWFPYDAEIENPINSSMPESLSYSDLKNMTPEFESMGASDLEGEGIANIKAGASIISRFNK